MFQRFGVVTLVCVGTLFDLLQVIKEVHIFRHSQKLKISVVHLNAPISQHKSPVVFIILGDQVKVLLVLLSCHILNYVFLFKIDGVSSSRAWLPLQNGMSKEQIRYIAPQFTVAGAHGLKVIIINKLLLIHFVFEPGLPIFPLSISSRLILHTSKSLIYFLQVIHQGFLVLIHLHYVAEIVDLFIFLDLGVRYVV